MMEGMTRKIDRRTIYTKNTIKDALLVALDSKPFEKIGVTDICRISEINRGTFYLHYGNLVDVLNEVLDDAIYGSRSVFKHLSVHCQECANPDENSLCRAVQRSGKYWPVFHDNSVAELILKRIAEQYKDEFVDELLAHSPLSRRQAEALYHFQINGCLAASRCMGGDTENDWRELQKALDCFIKGGLKAVCDTSVFTRET